MGLGYNSRWKILFVFVAIILLWQSSKLWFLNFQEEEPIVEAKSRNEVEEEKVYISVYYEALCPDSRSFFTKQLIPTYHKLFKYVEIEPIPYGKATTRKTDDGDYEFTCQHGPVECDANIIHACSIDAIKNLSLRLDYLSCMIKNNIKPVEIMESCAAKLNVKYDEILKCFTSGQGRQLLARYGDKTKSLIPPVIFIPTVTLNGELDDQASILKNLLHKVCQYFKIKPMECT